MNLDETRPMKNVRYAMSWIIEDAVREAPPNAVWVEIGVGVGTGLACMAHACDLAGRDDITIYGVDPFAGTARCGEQTRRASEATRHGDWALFLDIMQNVAPRELRRVHLLRCTSMQALNMFTHSLVDLVIVDGAHDLESVMWDLEWNNVVRPGGAIAGDDIVADSDVEKAVLMKFRKVERRGDPHSDGQQATWPTWRVRL